MNNEQTAGFQTSPPRPKIAGPVLIHSLERDDTPSLLRGCGHPQLVVIGPDVRSILRNLVMEPNTLAMLRGHQPCVICGRPTRDIVVVSPGDPDEELMQEMEKVLPCQFEILPMGEVFQTILAGFAPESLAAAETMLVVCTGDQVFL